MSDSAKWYVVHTYSGYENKVMQTILKDVEYRNMTDLIQQVKIPVNHVSETNDKGKTREVDQKVFPSYVLVKMIMTDESWFVVRNTRGVTGFVGPGSKPVPLTDREVEKLGVESDDDQTRTSNVKVSYAVGDRIKIINGPLKGLSGCITAVDTENMTVDVNVSFLGRETPSSSISIYDIVADE